MGSLRDFTRIRGDRLVATAPATAATTTAAVATAATATAAAAAVATTATTTTAAATATGAIFAGLGFIDGQGAAFVFMAVECGNGRLCFGIRTHLDEPETFAATGVPVIDDFGALHGAVRTEQLLQSGAIDAVGEVAYI